MADIAHPAAVGPLPQVYRWLRANLFGTPLSALLTILVCYALIRIVPAFIDWAFVNATWTAPNEQACAARGGACWAFITQWYRFILFGRYPYAEQWRPTVVVLLLIALLLVSCERRLPGRALALMWVVGVVAVLVLMGGGVLGLAPVDTDLWNGLPLALILAVGGLALSFPLGVALALGRRSQMRGIRGFSIAYIEFFRGLPFITVLFMAAHMVPLFLPPGMTTALLWRIEVAFILFLAAYLAEAVRGGLQAIPRGQYEAALALGFGYWRQMRLVILPQALRIAIPPLVGTFIGAFKDTALVSFVGLFDLLQDVAVGTNDPGWRSSYAEGYAFVAAIYFVFCYAMSRYSRSLEARR
ncbi:MAG TPA: amino acid ABC transporter permease [Stellaceae bacterium]|nr:amino acid ABC transporter permease [Stellaceae bacterium]